MRYGWGVLGAGLSLLLLCPPPPLPQEAGGIDRLGGYLLPWALCPSWWVSSWRWGGLGAPGGRPPAVMNPAKFGCL